MYVMDGDDADVIGPVGPRNGHQNGSLFFTPAKNPALKQQERVFKTPMTFSPRIVGDQVKPSPSRMELWKEQLGLDDTTANGMSDSDQSLDDDDEEKENNEANGSCSIIEFQAMQRELNERNIQRDDLLFRIKSLTDKNKHYQHRIDKEESSKKQQIKIIKKTHETHLQEKQNLIKDLEDVIEELEAKQSSVGEGATPFGEVQQGTVTKLVEQLSELQSEKAEISTELLSAQHILDSQKDEVNSIKTYNLVLEKQAAKLEEELLSLKNFKGSNVNEAERKLFRREEEIEKLQKELHMVTSKLVTSNGHCDGNAEIVKKLNEENQSLKVQLGNLSSQLEKRFKPLTRSRIN